MSEPFFKPDEYFLLMDVPNVAGRQFSEEELRALRDVGVQTTICFYNRWGEVEAVQGKYDWGKLDEYVARATRAGLKVLIPCYTEAPHWFHESWYLMNRAGGRVTGVINPWNPMAVGYMLNWYKDVVTRYTSSDCMVINHWLTHGETLGLNEPYWFDPMAVHSFRSYQQQAGSGTADYPMPNTESTDNWLRETLLGLWLEQQEIIVAAQWKEVWCMLHPAIATYYAGSQWMKEAIAALRLKWEDAVVINQCFYTWVQWEQLWSKMDAVRTRYNTNVFGGAEYCEGILGTSRLALQHGLRGLICAPCHPFTGHEHLEPWMLSNLRASQELWAREREG